MVISWKQHFLSQIATFVEKDMWYVNRPIYEEKKTMVNGQQTKSRKKTYMMNMYILAKEFLSYNIELNI